MISVLSFLLVFSAIGSSIGLECREGFIYTIPDFGDAGAEKSLAFNRCPESISDPVCLAAKGSGSTTYGGLLGSDWAFSVTLSYYKCANRRDCASQTCAELLSENRETNPDTLNDVISRSCEPIKCCSEDGCNSMEYETVSDQPAVTTVGPSYPRWSSNATMEYEPWLRTNATYVIKNTTDIIRYVTGNTTGVITNQNSTYSYDNTPTTVSNSRDSPTTTAGSSEVSSTLFNLIACYYAARLLY